MAGATSYTIVKKFGNLMGIKLKKLTPSSYETDHGWVYTNFKVSLPPGTKCELDRYGGEEYPIQNLTCYPL
jgi:hypothetical protein